MTEIDISNQIIKAFDQGNKLMICGNGGSAAQAQHFAGELVGKFEYSRRALPALALTTDTSIITAWANDQSFDDIFSRQIEALGKPGDILLAISTSGRSRNCIRALETAQRIGLVGIDLPRIGRTTADIQEYHLRLIHNICRKVERAFITPEPFHDWAEWEKTIPADQPKFYDDGCSTQMIK